MKLITREIRGHFERNRSELSIFVVTRKEKRSIDLTHLRGEKYIELLRGIFTCFLFFISFIEFYELIPPPLIHRFKTTSEGFFSLSR